MILLILSAVVIYLFRYFDTITQKVNFIEFPAEVIIPQKFATITKKRDSVHFKAHKNIYLNHKKIDSIDLTNTTVIDTFEIADLNVTFEMQPQPLQWSTVFERDFYDLNAISCTYLQIGTNPLLQWNILKIDKTKVSSLTSEDTLIRFLPPKDATVFPVKLLENSIRIAVTDSIVFLRSGDNISQLKPISKHVKHEVVQGEVLYSIAKRYGTTVEAIKLNNHLQSDRMDIGQVLSVQIPQLYDLFDGDILYIGSEKSPLYTIRIRLFPTTYEDISDDFSIKTSTISIQELKHNKNKEARTINMSYYKNGKKIKTQPLDMDTKNVLVSSRNFFSIIPLPGYRPLIPQKIHDYKAYETLNSVLPEIYASILEPLFQRNIYNINSIQVKKNEAVVNDTIYLPITKDIRTFINSIHWDVFYYKKIKAISDLLSTPGIAFYLQTDSLTTVRHLYSDETWKVSTDKNHKAFSVTTGYREFEFTHNPGKFLYMPYFANMDANTIIFETNFSYHGQHELLRVLKICGFTNYDIELNGVMIRSDDFNFNNRGDNLLENKQVYNQIIRNLMPNNQLKIHVSYRSELVNPVFPKAIPFSYSYNKQLISSINEDWEYALTLAKRNSEKEKWSQGIWHPFEESIAKIMDFPRGKANYIFYFRKQLTVAEDKATITLENKNSNIQFYVDGRKIDKAIELRNGTYWLGVEYKLRFDPLFSKTNWISDLLYEQHFSTIPEIDLIKEHNNSSPFISTYSKSHAKYRVQSKSTSYDIQAVTGSVRYLNLETGKLSNNKITDLPSLCISTDLAGTLSIWGANIDSTYSAFAGDNQIDFEPDVSFQLLCQMSENDIFSINDVNIYFYNEADLLAYDINEIGKSSRYYNTKYNSNSLVGYQLNPQENFGLEKTIQELDENYIVELTIHSEWQQIAEEILQEIIKDEKQNDKNYIQNNRHSNDIDKETLAGFLQFKKHYEGGIIIVDETGKIVVSASYSDGNLEGNDSVRKALYLKTFANQLAAFDNINWDRRFFPGSSFKIVDALTIFSAESILARNDMRVSYINNILAGYPTQAGEVTLRRSNMLSEGNRDLIVHISNHRNHRCPHGTQMKEAFARSYNTYFSYAMLHLNHGSIVDPRKHIIYNALDFDSKVSQFPLFFWIEALQFNNYIEFVNCKIQNKTLHQSSIPSIVRDFGYDQADIAHLAIGQNVIEITPLQQIIILSLVANANGEYVHPYLINSVYDISKNKAVFQAKQEKELIKKIDKRTYIKTKDLMREVIININGTGRIMRNLETDNRFQFYAKTGTAEMDNPSNLNHAWFVGFAEDSQTGKTYYFVSVFPYTLKEGAAIAGRAMYQFFDKIKLEENYE